MEARGQEPNQTLSSICYGGAEEKGECSGSDMINHGVDLSQDFHVYGLNWTTDAMIFSIDGKEFHRETLTKSFNSGRGIDLYEKEGQPFDMKFSWSIDLAVGGDFFPRDQYPGLMPCQAGRWQQPRFEIDYVRVYKHDSI